MNLDKVTHEELISLLKKRGCIITKQLVETEISVEAPTLGLDKPVKIPAQVEIEVCLMADENNKLLIETRQVTKPKDYSYDPNLVEEGS